MTIGERIPGWRRAAGVRSGELQRRGPELADSVAAAPALDLDNLEITAAAGNGAPVFVMLLTAFAAGFILNFMPCVLPVIGLKLMAFVEQSGQSRGKTLALNILVQPSD